MCFAVKIVCICIERIHSQRHERLLHGVSCQNDIPYRIRHNRHIAKSVHKSHTTKFKNKIEKMVKQPILSELESFISGVANFYTLPSNALVKLSQCSLNLLENLPASRDAVFEYFALIFDRSVSNYVQSFEVIVYSCDVAKFKA